MRDCRVAVGRLIRRFARTTDNGLHDHGAARNLATADDPIDAALPTAVALCLLRFTD